MQFNSFSDFINMGGYGFYVWLSFGSAACILSLLLFNSQKGHLYVMIEIDRHRQREDRLRQARALRKQQSLQQDKALKKVTE
ncbi:MAG: heme exporter protein CcmD [Colwellia sp.]